MKRAQRRDRDLVAAILRLRRRGCLGFILRRGKLGFEALDREEVSLGIFQTQTAAANAVFDAAANARSVAS